MITGYPIDGAMGSSGGGRAQKLSMVCLHNNAIVARGILGTILHCGTPNCFVSSVGTSLRVIFHCCLQILHNNWSDCQTVGLI